MNIYSFPLFQLAYHHHLAGGARTDRLPVEAGGRSWLRPRDDDDKLIEKEEMSICSFLPIPYSVAYWLCVPMRAVFPTITLPPYDPLERLLILRPRFPRFSQC